MEKLLLYGCFVISCAIIVGIEFHFMDDRYERSYSSKGLYYAVAIIPVFVVSGINMLQIWVLNLGSWGVIVTLWAVFFYHEHIDRPVKRVAMCLVLLLNIAMAECLGYFATRWMFSLLPSPGPVVQECIEVCVSKIFVIFVYFVGITKLLGRKKEHYVETKAAEYVAILLLCVVGIFLMTLGIQSNEIPYESILLRMSLIVFLDFVFLYLLKVGEEKRYYEAEVRALEQQARMQLEYYSRQEEKLAQTTQILHDVNRHVRAVQSLSASGNTNAAREYADQIDGLLKPLIPVNYTGNPLLDILLSDKERQAEKKGIGFNVAVNGAKFGFMDAIDITTIFGNLLDNAIEACEALPKERDRSISIIAKSLNDMVSVTIENDSPAVKWRDGAPVSAKGKDRGIGLINVRRSIEKYDGDVTFSEKNGKFLAEFFLNM